MKRIFGLILMISLAFGTLTAQKALVIGNSGYGSRALPTVAKDATMISDTLSAKGWKVTKHVNLDKASLKKAIISFGEKLSADEIALFYYTGSAIQIGGKNYLVPVGKIEDEKAFLQEPVELGWMLGQLGKAKIRLVFIDGARTAENITFKLEKQGMAALQKMPSQTLLMYSAALNTASPNSYFAPAVIQELIKPDQDLGKLGDKISATMKAMYPDKTPPSPYSASSISGDWELNPSDDNTIRFRFRGVMKGIPDGGGSYSF